MRTESEIKRKIDFIKSFREPPNNNDDPYNTRYPWRLFGAVDQGISWKWFQDRYILAFATENDIELAYSEVKELRPGK